jgi:hypothetical protein
MFAKLVHLVVCLGKNSIAHISATDLAPISSIDGNINGSDVLTN